MTPDAISDGDTGHEGGHPTGPRAALRSAGLRVTRPRVAALGWLGQHPHSTADQVAVAVRDDLGSVSTQAVYDVLNTCTDAKLLRRIEPAGHPARFETRTADNHHHLVCRKCGRADDVNCVHGAAPCLTPSSDAGYAVDEAEIVFWGLCPACQLPAAEPESGEQQDSHHHEEEQP